jgi:hypothetical protein
MFLLDLNPVNAVTEDALGAALEARTEETMRVFMSWAATIFANRMCKTEIYCLKERDSSKCGSIYDSSQNFILMH